MIAKAISFLCSILCCGVICGQTTVKGFIADAETKEGLIGAAVVIEGTTIGVTSDIDGNFELTTNTALPFNVRISYISYLSTTVAVTEENASNLRIVMRTDAVVMGAVEVKAQRISQKQQQAALTVETMDVIAIKEASSGNFYESLGNLKGVDVTSASLGFKVINTRGFNSTSPVRSLQLIDGVDNQSPGLNFSLGNFLGASDLDVRSVDIIAGASSAFYGPGAFNGVVNMTTKDPFDFPGVSVEVKAGERALFQRVVRLADAPKGKDGKKRFGYELNYFSLTANDWEAENYDAIEGSEFDADYPFGYDAVNIYGDEPTATNNINPSQTGLSTFLRNGYRESDLIEYDTDNSKFGASLMYRIKEDVTVSYGLNYSTGNTVYQGDNRYALRGVQFWQNKVEIGKKDKWFIRGYRTGEDAGQTYDVVTTAIRMQEAQGTTATWNNRYKTNWSNLDGYPMLDSLDMVFTDQVFEELNNGEIPAGTGQQRLAELWNLWTNDNATFLSGMHQENIDAINGQDGAQLEPFYEPGTARFDSLFRDVTSRTFTEGGSRFYDKSSLTHLQGEYRFDIGEFSMRVGANNRWYRPDSRGTIFSDTLDYTYQRDSLGQLVLMNGRPIALDSNRVQIKNKEWGAYLGVEKKFMYDLLTANVTVRVDKNENFDHIISPALSLVYTPDETNTFRASFSSAVRNPTLADQYLYYNVGRAILLGNVDGRFEAGSDSLFTISSFSDYRNQEQLNRDTLDYFNVDAIRPEQVRTIELGYRGKITESLFIDGGGYYSTYTDFIGFQIGLTAEFNPAFLTAPPTNITAYRVAANAKSTVTTTGASIGFNYYLKKLSLSGNYSFNQLVTGDDDPIIPAFNTPKHKFNLGVSAREVMLFGKIPHFGYGMNYKWIEGFLFEGSPQFTGSIPTYDMIDAQINLYVPALKSTFKLGGSNIMGIRPLFAKGVEDRWQSARDNRNYQVYGGPRVGRLLYASILIELK